MAIRIYKPTSPGRRNASVIDYKKELTAARPEKGLCRRIKKSGGRNHKGQTTVRFRGGGARRIYRIIDFKRNKDDMSAKVEALKQLAQLKDQGILTDEEFAAQKAKILG